MGLNLLAKGFGKKADFTIGLILLPWIFLPILVLVNPNTRDLPVNESTVPIVADLFCNILTCTNI
jgi:hypothetical protein